MEVPKHFLISGEFMLTNRRIIFQSIIFDCYPEGNPPLHYSSLSSLCSKNYIHCGMQLHRPCHCDGVQCEKASGGSPWRKTLHSADSLKGSEIIRSTECNPLTNNLSSVIKSCLTWSFHWSLVKEEEVTLGEHGNIWQLVFPAVRNFAAPAGSWLLHGVPAPIAVRINT